jgi:hypothetical protein
LKPADNCFCASSNTAFAKAEPAAKAVQVDKAKTTTAGEVVHSLRSAPYRAERIAQGQWTNVLAQPDGNVWFYFQPEDLGASLRLVTILV